MVCSAGVKLNPAATIWRLLFPWITHPGNEIESLDVEACYPIRQVWKGNFYKKGSTRLHSNMYCPIHRVLGFDGSCSSLPMILV